MSLNALLRRHVESAAAKNAIMAKSERAIRATSFPKGSNCGWTKDYRYLRCSQLHDVCSRAAVLAHRHREADPGVFDFASMVRMYTGTALHTFFQDQILGPMGVLFGGWRCKNCTQESHGFVPKRCSQCGCDSFGYIEFAFADDDVGISGHIDGVICLNRLEAAAGGKELSDEMKPVMLEIKSTNTRGFQEISKTQKIPEYYKTQNMVYHYLTGYRYPETLFLYLDRDSCAISIFPVPYESGAEDDAISKALTVKHCVHSGEIPERACISPKCDRAAKCPFRERCFCEIQD